MVILASERVALDLVHTQLDSLVEKLYPHQLIFCDFSQLGKLIRDLVDLGRLVIKAIMILRIRQVQDYLQTVGWFW